jgi:hypothetical protein
MSAVQGEAKAVETSSGRISYLEAGSGPVALFAHSDTEMAPDQDVSVTANANMLREFLDAREIDQIDVIGNDSGEGNADLRRSHPEWSGWSGSAMLTPLRHNCWLD